MRHDYLLGRANCQKFLRSTFVLHEDNLIFRNGVWTAAQMHSLGQTVRGERYLPIIPLLGNAAEPESSDQWPHGRLDPNTYRDAIEKRFKGILNFEGSGGIVSTVVSLLIAHFGEGRVGDFVVNAMKKALVDNGLD